MTGDRDPDAGAQGALRLLCRPTPDGFACEVVVGADAAATRHSVTISRAELERLAPGHYDPDALVGASFAFLLAREPREAIMPRFAISVIERYFPGYEAAMRARMAAPAPAPTQET